MKKAFLLLLTVVVLTSVVWLKAGAANVTPIKATVYSESFTEVPEGQRVTARMMNADSALQNLYCVATELPGYISCQFDDKYAGQQVGIELTNNKVMYVYVIDLSKN